MLKHMGITPRHILHDPGSIARFAESNHMDVKTATSMLTDDAAIPDMAYPIGHCDNWDAENHVCLGHPGKLSPNEY